MFRMEMAAQTQAGGENGGGIQRRFSRYAANAIGSKQLLHEMGNPFFSLRQFASQRSLRASARTELIPLLDAELVRCMLFSARGRNTGAWHDFNAPEFRF